MSFRPFTLTEAVRDMPGVQDAADQDGLAILVRRGKPPLVVVHADLLIRMLCVVDQMRGFLADPTIARLAAITGLFSQSVSALKDEPLKNPNWLPEALAELQALIQVE